MITFDVKKTIQSYIQENLDFADKLQEVLTDQFHEILESYIDDNIDIEDMIREEIMSNLDDYEYVIRDLIGDRIKEMFD